MMQWLAVIVALTALLGVGWGFSSNLIRLGEAKCEAKDDAALIAQLQQQKAQLEADKVKIQESDDARIKAEKTLADIRAQPHPHLVCHSATAPVQPSEEHAGVPGGGVLPPSDGAGFDPTDGAYAVADEADEFAMSCKNEIERITR